MAKNTSSSAFRKIDVDQYNEDNFREDEADSAVAQLDENEITTLLTQGKFIEALLLVLQNAPLRCKQQHVKVIITFLQYEKYINSFTPINSYNRTTPSI